MAGQIVVGGQVAWEHKCGDGCACRYHTFDGLQLGPFPPRKLHVLLPESYLDTSVGAMPVLYMNDGNAVMFDGEAGNDSLSLLMHEAVHSALNEATFTKSTGAGMIVVALAPLDRDREYTHVELPGGGGGGLAQYLEFLSDQLVPFIDANYRTVAHSRGRAIGGCSHGGLAAFLSACRLPRTFGAALCFSPSLWLGMDSTGDGCRVAVKGLSSRAEVEDIDAYSTDEELLAFCHMSESDLYRECKGTFGSPSERISMQCCGTWPFACDEVNLSYHRPRFYIDWGLLRVGGMHNMLTEAMVTKRCREIVELLVVHHEYSIGGEQSGGLSELLPVEDPEGGHDMLAWRFRLPRALTWLLTGINNIN